MLFLLNSTENFETTAKLYFEKQNYANKPQMDTNLINLTSLPIASSEYSSGGDIHSFAIGFLTFLGLSIIFSLSTVLYHFIKERIEPTVSDTNTSSSAEELTSDLNETSANVFPPATEDSRKNISFDAESSLTAGCTAIDISMPSSSHGNITIPSFSYGDISLSSIIDFQSSFSSEYF